LIGSIVVFLQLGLVCADDWLWLCEMMVGEWPADLCSICCCGCCCCCCREVFDAVVCFEEKVMQQVIEGELLFTPQRMGTAMQIIRWLT
jgi:hypothetical protein